MKLVKDNYLERKEERKEGKSHIISSSGFGMWAFWYAIQDFWMADFDFQILFKHSDEQGAFKSTEDMLDATSWNILIV